MNLSYKSSDITLATRIETYFCSETICSHPREPALHNGWKRKGSTVTQDHIAMREKWDDWLKELEPEMRFFLISDAADKKDAMLIYRGAEIRRLEKRLQDSEDGDVYAQFQSKLGNYFPQRKMYTMPDIYF